MTQTTLNCQFIENYDEDVCGDGNVIAPLIVGGASMWKNKQR